MNVHISYSKSIFIDDIIYEYGSFVLKYDLNSVINQNKYHFTREDIPLEQNKPYHKIMISLYSGDSDKFKKMVDDVIKRCRLKVQVSLFDEPDNIERTGGFLHMEICEKPIFRKTEYYYFLYLYE